VRRYLALALCVAVAISVAACSTLTKITPAAGPVVTLASPAVPTQGDASAATSSALAAPIATFGFDLLRALDADPQRGPQTVISPLSVHTDLAMVADGANGQTLSQMRTALDLAGMNEASSNAAYANLLARLDASKDVVVSVANSLWIDKGFAVEPSYLATNKRYFGAAIRSLDLQAASAVTAINDWVSSATKGKITQLLESPPPADTVLFVINATYFKGDWLSPFDPNMTAKQAFHLPAGTAEVETMHQTSEWRYAQTPDLQAVELPYKGDAVRMVVLLPSTTSSLDKLVDNLTAEKFAALRASLEPTRVALSLPKTEVRWGASLVSELKALGMTDAFSRETADLGRISTSQGLFVQDVLHKTYLRVDEKGTEAAAVTSTQIGATALPVTPPVEMTVDRPYLMAIVDNDSGAVLFLAAVRDPRAAP